VLLRLAYLGVTNAFAMLRLLSMSDRAKDVEIIALRHQITVLGRQLGTEKVRLEASDRAFLAALLHRLRSEVLRSVRLPVRPDTVLRWHRDLIARRHAAASRTYLRWAVDLPPSSVVRTNPIARLVSNEARPIRQAWLAARPAISAGRADPVQRDHRRHRRVLIGWRLSDRTGRRKVFIITASIVYGPAMFLIAAASTPANARPRSSREPPGSERVEVLPTWPEPSRGNQPRPCSTAHDAADHHLHQISPSITSGSSPPGDLSSE
jgi:hypothetical protein